MAKEVGKGVGGRRRGREIPQNDFRIANALALLVERRVQLHIDLLQVQTSTYTAKDQAQNPLTAALTQ